MSNARVLGDAPWLKSGPTARVLGLLNGNGEEARVVGGAVRNALLQIPHGDIDIATTALPDEVIRRARAAGIKSVPTGIEHGTVTLVVDAQPFEVTTLREDTETFGRKAKVAFGRDWVRDAERRDFTINGLSVDAAGVVHDHVGGLDDILAKRVRFIGDPDQRIAEDYLRILRFFRIHAAYGAGELERNGYLACIRARAGLATLSAERVRMEMLKLVIADGAAGAVEAMADGGLLLPIFGGIGYTGPFAAMISAERLLGLKPDAVRRLGALAVAVTEDARRVATRLRLSNAETKALDSLGHRWWRLGGMDEAIARRRLYRLGKDRYRDRLMLAWARAGAGANSAHWRELATLPERWSAPKFPLKAADFVARGITEGPALVRVPLVGAEPVVPIIAISAIFTNSSRFAAYLRHADLRRAGIVVAAAALTTALGAYGYTRLSNAGAALVIGAMLISSVPLRRSLKRRDVKIGDTGLAAGAVGYGVLVGGTSGSGVILLSLLMAAGLEGAAVIATDAVISVTTSMIKISVFGLSGVVTAQVLAFAVLIGAIALPGAFLAKAFVERMPVHIHTAILDAAVITGGVVMTLSAARSLLH